MSQCLMTEKESKIIIPGNLASINGDQKSRPSFKFRNASNKGSNTIKKHKRNGVSNTKRKSKCGKNDRAPGKKSNKLKNTKSPNSNQISDFSEMKPQKFGLSEPQKHIENYVMIGNSNWLRPKPKNSIQKDNGKKRHEEERPFKCIPEQQEEGNCFSSANSGCKLDPHHGHKHHHKHEYHHEGGHHHHSDINENIEWKLHAENMCIRSDCCKDPNCDELSLSSGETEEPKSDMKNEANVIIDFLPLQTTKLRVQNICCPKEARIVEEELDKLDGVKKIRVNVIGRVAYISHDSDASPPSELVKALNRRHLGASVVDAGAEESEKGVPRELMILLAFLVLQAVLFIVAVTAMLLHTSWYMWVALAQIVLGILPVLRRCIHALYHLSIDLNILITITVIGTVIIQQWIEGAAVVVVFSLANVLQQFCFHHVQKTISGLMLSKPSTALMACSGDCVPISEVAIGSIIAVRQGEIVPLDGIVVKGSATVDESSITGEATPVEKKVKSVTYSGTVIQHGYLELETTSSSTTSTISRIATMIEDAQMNVSPMEIMMNNFAAYYTPLVVVLAALVFVIPMILDLSGVDAYSGSLKVWGERALIVLVTACPCALVMATPIVVICGINGGARLGTLIKGGTFLEALSQIGFLAFDKTGTLTEGKFRVVDIMAVEKDRQIDILRWAAALESKSSHPLAAAVVAEFTGECVATFEAETEEMELPDVKHFRTLEGQGISGYVEGHSIDIGNYALLDSIDVTLPTTFQTAYNKFCDESKTVVFVCVDEELALMISLADIIREDSYKAVKWLQDLGIDLAMLTGDSKKTAAAVQKQLKLDSCVSEMKPDDKLKWIMQIKEKEARKKSGCFNKKPVQTVVAMVGDGVNDGPALAAADVGIAMAAGGSALAVEAAGVALTGNSILKVPEAICLSRFCRRIIIQNIALAVLLKVVFVVVALTGYVRVWMAVVADLVGLLLVILNGLRPLNWEPPRSRTQNGETPKRFWHRRKQPAQYTVLKQEK